MLADSCFTACSTPVDEVAVSEGETDAERTMNHCHRVHVNRLDADASNAPDERRWPHSIYTLYTLYNVSRRRRKIYCGHARLCVCLCVCLPACPRPYAHTNARTRM